MAIRQILQYPDPRLRVKASEVITFDDALQSLIQDMFDTMYAANGVGLAATQINVHQQVIVMDMPETRGPLVLVNPHWEPIGEDLSTLEEGCLSVPGYYDLLPRYARVKLKALDAAGRPYEENAEGLFALCVQHEYDHLQGKVFVDDLSNLRKQRALAAMAKRKKNITKQK